MLNQTPVIEAIRHVHHALSACIHDDLDATEDCLRHALTHLLELVDLATRLDLVREFQEEVAIPEG